jgi:hypothetical protein
MLPAIHTKPSPTALHPRSCKKTCRTYPFFSACGGGEWLPWGVSNLEYVSLPVNISFYTLFASAVLIFFWFVPFARRSWGVKLASYRSTTCWDLKRVIWEDLWVFSLTTTPLPCRLASSITSMSPQPPGVIFLMCFFSLSHPIWWKGVPCHPGKM